MPSSNVPAPLYEYKKYIANKENVKDVLSLYGVAIIPNVLTHNECVNMNNGMWDTLEHLTNTWKLPIRRDNHLSWRELRKLYPSHSMLLQHWSIGHAQYVWDIRSNVNVAGIFASIWSCNVNDLLVSFDGVSYHMPPEITNLGWHKNVHWYHADQSFLNEGFKCVQGYVTGNAVREGDSTLTVLECSHMYQVDFQRRFNTTSKKNWYKLNIEEQNYYVNDMKCRKVSIKCPEGSLVLWDSRTIHCGMGVLKGRSNPTFRNVAYVCYEPRIHCPSSKILKKRVAFESLRMTTHYPCDVKLFPMYPQTYGSPLPSITSLFPPVLSDFGKRLAGYD